MLRYILVSAFAGVGWVTQRVPATTLIYTLLTGLAEMLILGALYGLLLRAPQTTR